MPERSEQRRSLYEFVRIHGAKRRYLEHTAELEALRNAVFDLGLPSFEAESLLLGGAEACGVALESRVDRVMEVLLRASTDRRGAVDKNDFLRLARYARALSNDALSEAEAEAKVKAIVQRLEIPPRRQGLLGGVRWFRRAGRANGAAGTKSA